MMIETKIYALATKTTIHTAGNCLRVFQSLCRNQNQSLHFNINESKTRKTEEEDDEKRNIRTQRALFICDRPNTLIIYGTHVMNAVRSRTFQNGNGLKIAKVN